MEDTAHFSAKEAEADGSTVAGSLVGWCPCLSKAARIAGECSAEGARVQWLWCGLLATRMCVCVYMEYRYSISEDANPVVFLGPGLGVCGQLSRPTLAGQPRIWADLD